MQQQFKCNGTMQVPRDACSSIIIGLILPSTYVVQYVGKYYVADRMMSLNGTHQMNGCYEYDVLDFTNVGTYFQKYFK